MRPVHQSVRVQNFKVLANRNLRSLKLPGEFGHQDPALMVQQVDNGTTSFFVEHGIQPESERIASRNAVSKRISFYSVLFRLSRGKNCSSIGSSRCDLAFGAVHSPLFRAVQSSCKPLIYRPLEPPAAITNSIPA